MIYSAVLREALLAGGDSLPAFTQVEGGVREDHDTVELTEKVAHAMGMNLVRDRDGLWHWQVGGHEDQPVEESIGYRTKHQAVEGLAARINDLVG